MINWKNKASEECCHIFLHIDAKKSAQKRLESLEIALSDGFGTVKNEQIMIKLWHIYYI